MFISACCEGERCRCGEPAAHKIEEVIFDDDPMQGRHPLTAYICHAHFVEIMGPMADSPGYLSRWGHVGETPERRHIVPDTSPGST